jgi:integrase
MPMIVNDLIDAYEKHLAQGSPATVRRFAPIGVAIRTALGDRDHFDVTPAEIRDVLMEATKGHSERNRYVWLSYTKALWFYPERWLDQEDTERKNPFRKNGALGALFPKPKPKVRAYLLPEDVDLIVRSPTKRRPRLILALLRGTGIRLSELLSLEARDVQDAIAGSGDGRRLVLRKPKSGQEDETVALPKEVAQFLKRYLLKQGLTGPDRIFPISPQAVREVVKRAGARFGIALSPHDLRRAWASRKARQGVPIDVIRAGLRHKGEATTKGYISPVDFKELLDMTDKTDGEGTKEEPKGESDP